MKTTEIIATNTVSSVKFTLEIDKYDDGDKIYVLTSQNMLKGGELISVETYLRLSKRVKNLLNI